MSSLLMPWKLLDGHDSSSLRRYTLRIDGFVSAYALTLGRRPVTKPIVFTGQHLTLNFASSAAGGIEVELQDASGLAARVHPRGLPTHFRRVRSSAP